MVYTMDRIYSLCGLVCKASDTQAVGRGFESRPDHYNRS